VSGIKKEGKAEVEEEVYGKIQVKVSRSNLEGKY
jgi:hypothetical protein